MHTTLGTDSSDPAFCPEEPSAESLGLLTATIDEEIERIFAALPDEPAVEPIAGRKEDVRERLRAADPGGLGRPDHPPPRRLPPRPDALGERRLDDHRLRGRARALAAGAAPQALAAPRRRRDAALVRLRRLGREDPARRRAAAPTGSSAPAASSSTPTSSTVDPTLLPAGTRRGRPPARDLRAREGGLRAALRARPPPRLGLDPGRRASSACSSRKAYESQ